MIRKSIGKLTDKRERKDHISGIMKRNSSNKAFFFGSGGFIDKPLNVDFDRNDPNLKIDTRNFSDLYAFYNNPEAKITFNNGNKKFDELLVLNPEVKLFLHYIKMIIKKVRSKDTSNPNIHLYPISQNKAILTMGMTEHENNAYWNQEAGDIIENKVNNVLTYFFDNVRRDVMNTVENKINRCDFEISNNDSDLKIFIECKIISNKIFHSNNSFKHERFKAISFKRLKRVKRGIDSFNNFLNPANSRTYNYTKEDFDLITDSVAKSLERFRENYEYHFRQKDDEATNVIIEKNKILDSAISKVEKDFKDKLEDSIITKSVYESEKNLRKSLEDKIEKSFTDLIKRNELLEKKLDKILKETEK